jgi:hypothetical protein
MSSVATRTCFMEIEGRYRVFCDGPFSECFATIMHDLAAAPPVEAVGVFCLIGDDAEADLRRILARSRACTGTGTVSLERSGGRPSTLYLWSAFPLQFVERCCPSGLTVAALTFEASSTREARQLVSSLLAHYESSP